MGYSTFSIQTALVPSSGSNEFDIFKPEGEAAYYIQSLRLKIACPSLPLAEIPNLEPELTRAERIKIIRDLEWGAPRKELTIYQKQGVDAVEIARVSCLNRTPYYSINLLQFLTDNADLTVGFDTSLTCRVQDVGYGLLSGDDELIIHGSGMRETYTPTGTPSPGGGGNFGAPSSLGNCTQSLIQVSNTPIRIAPTQAGRSYFVVSVQSGSSVWIGLGDEPEVGSGILLSGSASSYELNFYGGEIYAIAESSAVLSLTLCG